MADCNAYIVGGLSSIPCDELAIAELKRWFHSIRSNAEGASNFVRRGYNASLIVNDGEADRKAKLRANNILITLRAALNMAWREGKIEDDTAWRRLKPYRSVTRARARILTKDEVDRLLSAARPDLRKFILGGLYTGWRA